MPLRFVLPVFALLTWLLVGCSHNIRGVQTFAYQGGDLRGGSIAYPSLPPAGGPYSPLWQQCGEYNHPIYTEYAVHSLARGAVWVSYRPDLDGGEVTRLHEAVAGQPYALLSPLPGQSQKIVLSAWNAQLALDSASDGRISRFIKAYAQAPSVPEAGEPCSGGYAYGI